MEIIRLAMSLIGLLLFAITTTFILTHTLPKRRKGLRKVNDIGLDESPGTPAIKERIKLFERAISEAEVALKNTEIAMQRGEPGAHEKWKMQKHSLDVLKKATEDLKRYNDGYKPYLDWRPEEYAC